MSLPEDVPFKVVREKWNCYDIGHNLILKTKLVLLKLLKPVKIPLGETKEFVFQANPFFVCYSPFEEKGTPETRKITTKLMEESIIEDLDPKIIGDDIINEYELENGGFLRLRLLLNRVALTSLFSADGSPVIAVSHQIAPQVIMPRRIKRKPKKSKGIV